MLEVRGKPLVPLVPADGLEHLLQPVRHCRVGELSPYSGTIGDYVLRSQHRHTDQHPEGLPKYPGNLISLFFVKFLSLFLFRAS